MKRTRSGLLIATSLIPILLIASARPALADTFDGRPKILVHVSATTSKNTCEFGELVACNQAVTQGNTIPLGGPGYVFIYLLATRGTIPGLAGLQCGVFYQSGSPGDMNDLMGIDVFGWTLCGALEFPTPGPNEWPRPGGGNLITWDRTVDCQTGDVGVAGYFYAAAYSQDAFRITPRPVDQLAKVASCENVETVLLEYNDTGCAYFSPGAVNVGCNPCVQGCFIDPVETTTWSRIKTFAR